MKPNGLKIGFIGAGAMGEAMINGFTATGRVRPEQIMAGDPREIQRNHLHSKYGVSVTDDNRQVLAGCDYIFLAIKPQVMEEVLAGLSGCWRENHVLLSIAAGVGLDYLEKSSRPDIPAWRIMPNTPALVGEGMIVYCGGKNATEDQEKEILPLLSSLGLAERVPEAYMDAVTGLSGSGPAFVLYFLEAMIDGGVKAGLPRDLASRLAIQTLYGTAYMLKKENLHPAIFREKVTSPGGTTIYGLHVLERNAAAGTVMEAVFQAAQRSRELQR